MTINTHIVVNPAYPQALDLAQQIAEHGIPADAQLVFSNNRNRICMLERDGVQYNIKAFKPPRFPNSVIYRTLRQSKACRSYLYACRLQQLGFLTPQPIAYIECRKGLRLLESYYVSLQIERHEVRNWEEQPDNDNMLRQMAADMVRLHQKGVLHKDFSPGNILYIRHDDGSYDFYYVDLNRMCFDVHSHRRQMTNFSRIHMDPDQTARLARYYAEKASLDVEKTIAEALSQLSAYKRSRARRSKLKSLLGL